MFILVCDLIGSAVLCLASWKLVFECTNVRDFVVLVVKYHLTFHLAFLSSKL